MKLVASDVTIIIVKSSGHWILEEQPKQTTDALISGLGNMGSGIARSLLRAGHKLTVYNRTRSRAEVLEGQGALGCRLDRRGCRREAVLTMLADNRALESVVFGEDGILASLPRGGSHLCFEYDQRRAE